MSSTQMIFITLIAIAALAIASIAFFIFLDKRKEASDNKVKEKNNSEMESKLAEKEAAIKELRASMNERLKKSAIETEELRRKTISLEQENASMRNKTLSLQAQNEDILKDFDALENAFFEKTSEFAELEKLYMKNRATVAQYGLEDVELHPEEIDIRTAIKDILPDIKAMTETAQTDFSLKIGDIRDPRVLCDKKILNDMILELVFTALRYSEAGGKILLSIAQTGSTGPIAMFEYSCIYFGESFSFSTDIANKLGGVVSLQRTDDGGTAVMVDLQFPVSEVI